MKGRATAKAKSKMSNTIQFYSVSQVQTVALVKTMEDGGAKVTTVEGDPNSCKISGKTPLGEINGEYSYHAQSGTLTVVITKKPWEVPMNTIESHLRTALAQAAAVTRPRLFRSWKHPLWLRRRILRHQQVRLSNPKRSLLFLLRLIRLYAKRDGFKR